jgi:hypothetical protein
VNREFEWVIYYFFAWNLTKREFSITFQLPHLFRIVMRMTMSLMLTISPMMWSSSVAGTSYVLSRPRVQNAIFVQCTPGWAIKLYNHNVFAGCDSVMVLSKQLGVTENQLGKALKGTGTKVSETKLRKTFPGAFEFRDYGRARCLIVLKADGVSQWLDTAQAVPTKNTIVAEHSTQANELRDAIMSSRANTRSIIATSTDTINPDIAVSSEMDLSSGIFGVPVHVSKKATYWRRRLSALPERTTFLSSANKKMDCETQQRKSKAVMSTEPTKHRSMAALDIGRTRGAEATRKNLWTRSQAKST